ncbi:MAG: alpha/beta hydrolase [Microcoleaceae cyanobacterium]
MIKAFLRHWLSSVATLGLSLGWGGLIAPPAQSASNIVISLGSARTSVSVEDLSQFAQAGEVTPILALYGTLLRVENGEQVRELLQTPFDASPWAVDQVIDSPTGDLIFRRLGNVLKTETGENGSAALKEAIQTSLKSPGGLTVLQILQNFPGENILVDLAFSVQLLQDVFEILLEHEIILEEIESQAQSTVAVNPAAFSQDLRQPGPLSWEEIDLSFRNPRRDTSSPLYIYLPQAEEPAPLVVISHGLGSDPKTFEYVARHLASYGYAVAIPEHIGTSAAKFEQFFDGFDQPPQPAVFAQRPTDVTVLIDQLAQNSQFQGRIDFRNVGVMGQSFGGYTALAVAGARLNPTELDQGCNAPDRRITLNISTLLQCRALEIAQEETDFQDDRIRASLAVNPLTSLIFGEQGMAEIQIPLMMIGGSNDYVTPTIPEQIDAFTWLKTPWRHLVILTPGTHFSFLDEAEGRIAFPPEMIGPDPELAYPYLRAMSLAFFNRYLLKQTEYSPYVSQAYMSLLDELPFVLNILEQLTQEDVQRAIQNAENQSQQEAASE